MRIILCLSLMTYCLCLLKITSPIINSLPNNEIPYTLANFGEIHYGTVLKGTLATSSESTDLCSSIPALKNSNTILLVQRGNCSFVQKVLNGQKAGAKMVIVSDNIIEDTAHITMVDDGNGRLVHIPSIFISEQNGEILEKQLYKSTIEISMRFDIVQTDIVNVTLYLNINDRHSVVLVREMEKSVLQLGDRLRFNVSYYSEACAGCDQVDCYGSVDYCMITKSRTGGQLIDMQLRMYNLFLQNTKKWFSVYDQYDQECFGATQILSSCLDTLIAQITGKQVPSSYIKDKTSLLQTWQKDSRSSGIYSYPAAKVNGVKYLGNLDSDDVLEMVCASLKDAPFSGCGAYDYLDIVNQRGENIALILWIVLTVFVVICMIILGVYIYKKTVKKEITNEMSLKVTEIVTQYVKLASQNQKKTKDRELELSREDL